jgi:hypothetical protein
MLTPILEKAILSGKGSLKTFGIGGMGKNVLPVSDDRFIVIVNVVSFPHFPEDNTDLDNGPLSTLNRSVYQININTSSRQYHFPIRKAFNININDNNPQPDTYPLAGFGNSENIQTYLVCQSDVEILFCSPGSFGLTTKSNGITDSNSAGVQPTQGAGRVGIPGSLSQDLVMQTDYNAGIFLQQNKFQNTGVTQGSRSYNEYRIAVDDVTRYLQGGGTPNGQIQQNFQYPLGFVQYVEIFGLPTDLQ